MESNKLTSKELFAKPPFFIVGVGRSGTTLLMAMLNAHPQVAMPPETHFVRRYIVPNPPATLEQATSMLRNDKYFQRLDIDVSSVMSYFGELDMPFSWTGVYLFMLREYLQKSGKLYIGDKDPRSVEYLPVLHALFPESSVLHMVRDPRDVFLSRQKAGWSEGRSWLSHVMAYRIQFQLGREEGQRYFGSRYKEVQYERLIRQPETVLQNVCEFLGIDYDPAMLEFSRSADRLVAEDERAWKKNVSGPLLSDNFGKWRSELARKQIVRIESLCSAVFREGPYTKAFPDLTLRERGEISALMPALSMAEWLYKRRRERMVRSVVARIRSNRALLNGT